MDIADAIMESDSTDGANNDPKTKVIVMVDSSSEKKEGESSETKDELNPSPPNETLNPTNNSDKANIKPQSDSDDDSDITIVGESVPNPGSNAVQGGSVIQGVPGSYQTSTPLIIPSTNHPIIYPQPSRGTQMSPMSKVLGTHITAQTSGAFQIPQLSSGQVSTIMQLPVIRPQPGSQFQVLPNISSASIRIPTPSVSISPAGVNPLRVPLVVGSTPVSSGMLFQLPQSMLNGASVHPGGVMTIGSPVQLIQPNISITPKIAGQPSPIKPLPVPAVTINPISASHSPNRNILMKNHSIPSHLTFRTVSPDNIKPFTGKIVRLTAPVITPNPAGLINPTSFTTIKPVDEEDQGMESSVSRKLELNDEEDENGLSLECNEDIEEFDDSFEKKAGSDEESINNDNTKTSNTHEDKSNVNLLKPLDAVEEDEHKDIKTKTNEFGMLELEDLGLGLKKKEEPKVHASPRKVSMTRKIQDDEILYCEGCGCYGMAGEFVAQNSCSNTCNNIISAKIKDRHRKEKELEILKLRRIEKKANQLKPGKKKGSTGSMSEEDIKPPPVNTWIDPKKGFLWSKYLEFCGARSAPVRLFGRDPFPEPHGFREGMKLEAVDPLHQSLFCVVSVAEVIGSRLRLHFDGYGDSHDFWENSDSSNLFPAGWASTNKQRLSPPKGYSSRYFNWATYLSQTDSVAAPDSLFSVREVAVQESGADTTSQGWKIGMKLEACDRQNKSLVCVATVSNVVQGRILLHFDGWDMDYDYWTRPTSQNVKPVGWCAKNKKQLNPPKGNHPSAFSWSEYLQVTKCKPVPAWAFRSPGSFQNETDFHPGMRLEAVDVYNPTLLRVASVVNIEGRQIELHYDGWPDELNHWLEDDDPNIHPCGWAAKTGHPLNPPLTVQEVGNWTDRGGCSIPGCRGTGHIKGAKYLTHHSISACPYAPQNLESNSHIPDRLQGMDRELGEEANITSDGEGEGDNVALGRGNRRRKKRKFFDDDGENQRGANRKKRGSIDDEEVTTQSDERLQTDVKPAKISKRKSNSLEMKIEPDIKEEPLDFSKDCKPPPRLIKEDAGVQTRSPSPPTFYTEWEEGVRISVWQPGYLPQPSPTGSLPACWREHSKLLLGTKGNSGELTFTKAKHWNIDQVLEFLGCIPNLDKQSVEGPIRDQEIDGEALLLLTQNDITEILGVKLGPAIKIYNAIMAVRIRRE